LKPGANDIQIPARAERRPVVIYVTGGGFMVAPKESGLNLRTYLAEAGFVVASIQYRTVMDGANYKDGVEDVKSAVRYLRAHSDEYGIDPNKVAVWGQSAGGYLAAMAGANGNLKPFDMGDNLGQSSAAIGLALPQVLQMSGNIRMSLPLAWGRNSLYPLPVRSYPRRIETQQRMGRWWENVVR
jgi:hypothetical protein